MRFHKDGHEARRVDPHDYDGMCDLISWCGGQAIDDEDYLLIVPIPGGEVRARDRDWIIRDANGSFHVHGEPDWRPIVDPWPWFLSDRTP